MSQSVITNAFSPWLAARLADSKPARPDRMVFAWIEAQDESAEINPLGGIGYNRRKLALQLDRLG
ncbi:phage tail protein [Klebsiella michiganensis]|uniref:phage tail protein n=1 Tax=Klebsiella michiganensis TaxID=1134687 RepID=UPI001F1524F9|nr:phage tail protein [Klebsiella michiganensis]